MYQESKQIKKDDEKIVNNQKNKIPGKQQMLHLLTCFPVQLMNINAIKQTFLPIMQDVQIRVSESKMIKLIKHVHIYLYKIYG